MYDAIRSTGCDKPLLYNMTTSVSFIDDVLASKVNGGSFQWYPTGLTANHEQKGNLLPNVDKYLVPFNKQLKETKRPKFVYEFSPADTKGAYMYPAMARSFREAGFQFAAHFAYDPLHAAAANIEYRTHFFNIAYTPKKAIGLRIASEVFHSMPMYKSYGRFPENNQFNGVRLSPKEDLVEMVTTTKFLYSNNTKTNPKNLHSLENIAGTGSSPIVTYKGNGVYFIDKLENGIWRLEVMPDAYWVKDPFFVTYTQGEVAVTLSKKHAIKISLPDLGTDFNVKGINKNNTLKAIATDKSFNVYPGVYLLSKQGKEIGWKGTDFYKNIQLNEFYAPTKNPKQIYVVHQPIKEVSKGKDLKVTAKIISDKEPLQVELLILKKGGAEVVPMFKKEGVNYEAVLPKKYTDNTRFIRYYISFKIGDTYRSYPSGKEDTYLLNRRIYGDDMCLDESKPYETAIVNSSNPIELFNAMTDWGKLTKMNRKSVLEKYPSTKPGVAFLKVLTSKRNKTDDVISFRFYCRDKIKGRLLDLMNKKKLTIYGTSELNAKIHIQLLMKNGVAYGGIVDLNKQADFASIVLNKMIEEKYILLPKSYPSFQAYDFESKEKGSLVIEELEAIQITIKKENTNKKNEASVNITNVVLE